MNLEATETTLLKPESIFLNRNFVLLFSGKIISLLGDQIYAFALSWYILDITKSSVTMSIFLVINVLIGAFIAPFGGIIADRVNRKNILIQMDAVRGFIVVIAALLLYLHMMQIWMLYVSAVILAVCGALFSPAASAIIPNIVEDDQLTQATSMDQFAWSFCSIIGMLVSGVLYNLIGIAAIFLLNAISYFISGVMEACLNIPVKNSGISKNSSIYLEFNKAITALSESYHYINQNKLVIYLTLMYALFNLIVFPHALIYIPYTFNIILKATAVQLAIALVAPAVGNIIGSCLVQFFAGRYKLRSSILWGLSTWSFCIFIATGLFFLQTKGYFTVWDFTIYGSIMGAIGGAAFVFCCIPINVTFQKRISDEYRGRFWGFLSSLTALTTAIGLLIGGFLAQRVWMVLLFLSTSVALFLVDLWMINIKELKS